MIFIVKIFCICYTLLMNFDFSPHAILLLLAAIIAGLAVPMVWRQRKQAGGTELLLLLISLITWTLAEGIESGVSPISSKIFWTKIAYLGVLTAPLFLLFFVLNYTYNNRYLNRITKTLLSIIPIVSLILAWTNESHYLFWKDYIYRSGAFGNVLVLERGPAFWFYITYAYILLGICLLILVRTALRFRFLYRKQVILLLIVIPLAWSINIIYLFDFIPSIRGFDPTPFSFVLFALILSWSINRLKLFNLSPVARDLLVDKIHSYLLVLNRDLRLVDANVQMLKLLPLTNGAEHFSRMEQAIGQTHTVLFSRWPAFVHFLDNLRDDTQIIFQMDAGELSRTLEIHASAINDHNDNLAGWMIILEDITDNKKAMQTEQRSRRIAEALQEVALVVNASLDMTQTLQMALEQIGKVISYDTANISILEGEEIVIEHIRGFEEHETIRGMRIPLAGSPNQQALIHRHPVMYSDVQAVFPNYRETPHDVVHSLLCIPMYAKDQVLGFLTLDSHSYNHFSYEDVNIAAAFAAQVAIALQNASLFMEVTRRLKEQSILNEIIRIGSANLEMLDFTFQVEKQIRRFLSSPAILFAEYNPGEEMWRFIHNPNHPYMEAISREWNLDQGLTGFVIRNQKALFLPTALEVQRFLDEHNIENVGPQPKMFIGAPMVFQDQVIGALVTQDVNKEYSLSKDDFRLFTMIASQISLGFENVRLFAQMEQLALTDSLTGIFNRRHFFDVSSKKFLSASKQQECLAAIMLDVDHFKAINDRYGHLVGDQVLQTVAHTCQEALRETDVIGRYGGEEFSVLLPNTDLEEAIRIAERLRNAVQDVNLHVNGYEINITASFGVAAVVPSESSSMEKLLDASDQALYRAKEAGRNCVRSA